MPGARIGFIWVRTDVDNATGAAELPEPVKAGMAAAAKAMTTVPYWI